MSAPNWAICPRCLAEAIAARDRLLDATIAAYGTAPPEEYQRLMDAAQVPVDEATFETFREDYEFYGATEGEITASYSGHCEGCGLGVDFEHKRKFYEVRP